MRVLHAGKFYPPHWGGMETSLKNICESIRDMVELEVAVANEHLGTALEQLEGVPLLRLSNWGSLLSEPVTPGLPGLLRNTRADLIHIHEPNPIAILSYLASGCRAPLVVQYHDTIPEQKRLSRLYRPWRDAALHRAETIIVPSIEFAESSSDLKRWRHKCVAIPPGVDLEPLLAIEREYPCVVPSPLILAVGQLSSCKGFHYLVEAMEQVNGRLVIIGDGEMRPALEAQIRRLGLDGRVRLTGQVSRQTLVNWYSRADLFCLPACEPGETLGLAVAEAMAAGLPVVGTDAPVGTRVANVHGETGLAVPAGNLGALANALNLVANDARLRRRMGTAARQRARQQFDRRVTGRRIVELYRETVSNAGVRAGFAAMGAFALSRD